MAEFNREQREKELWAQLEGIHTRVYAAIGELASRHDACLAEYKLKLQQSDTLRDQNLDDRSKAALNDAMQAKWQAEKEAANLPNITRLAYGSKGGYTAVAPVLKQMKESGYLSVERIAECGPTDLYYHTTDTTPAQLEALAEDPELRRSWSALIDSMLKREEFAARYNAGDGGRGGAR